MIPQVCEREALSEALTRNPHLVHRHKSKHKTQYTSIDSYIRALLRQVTCLVTLSLGGQKTLNAYDVNTF